MDGGRIKGKKPDEANSHPLPFSTQPLWKFLLEMLNDKYRYGNIIAWTGNGTEFKLRDHQGAAREWGKRRNRANMTYEKMSRALRYYYKKNILRKVAGKKFVYRFVNPDEFESANDERIKYAESDDQSEPADVPPPQFLAYPKVGDGFQNLTFESVPSYHSWISWGEAPLAMNG